jgi:hypothetical protein
VSVAVISGSGLGGGITEESIEKVVPGIALESVEGLAVASAAFGVEDGEPEAFAIDAVALVAVAGEADGVERRLSSAPRSGLGR